MLAFFSSLLIVASKQQPVTGAGFPPAVQAIADRPNVFQSKTYVDTPLPSFEQAKPLLPSPVLELRPEWIRLYWKAWELAFRNLRKPEPGSGFVSNFIDPAFNANTFQWDTCFMAQFGRYAEPAFHFIGSLDNFYAKQHPDGYICREIVRKTGEDFIAGSIDDTANPPLFSWAEWQYYLFTGDRTRLSDVLPCLIRHYGWLKQHRTRPNGLYWNTGLGSGEDDLTRAGKAYSWIDMSAQQVQNALNISLISAAVGEREATTYFQSEALELSKKIVSSMWDPANGFFFDLLQDGTPTGIKTVLGFWPMMAHMVTKRQAAALEEHIKNINEFERPDPVPALSADEVGYTVDGQYWNGAVWAPTNYMVVKGLQDYGFEDDAERITAKYLANMSKVYETTGTIWENYAPEFAVGHGVRDMVGWSGLGPIAMLIENVIGIRVSADQNKITWRVRLSGQMGLKNLTLGKAHVSLLASHEAFGKRVLTVTTDAPFTLEVNVDDVKPLLFAVKAGTSQFNVPAPYAFTMNYLTLTPENASYNLSIHHLVTATSYRSPESAPTQLVDGDPSTEWSSKDGDSASATIDLGSERTILGVDVFWGKEYARAYSLEISKDGETSTRANETAKGHGNGEALNLRGQSYTGRYVRINCLATNGTDPYYSILELQVWGH